MFVKRGFTLIELLVVMAILGLLLSILLPSLAAARESGRSVKCLANMRQMAVALAMYMKDYDELPSVGMGHGSHHVDEQGSWFRQMATYVGNEDLLYRCPSDVSPHWDTPPETGGRLRKVSFGTNYYLSGMMSGYESYRLLASIPRPSKTIFAVELAETGEFYAADHIHADLWIIDPANKPREQVAADRHLGRSNYCFVDGHAESLELEDIYKIGEGSTPFKINWVHNLLDPKVAR